MERQTTFTINFKTKEGRSCFKYVATPMTENNAKELAEQIANKHHMYAVSIERNFIRPQGFDLDDRESDTVFANLLDVAFNVQKHFKAVKYDNVDLYKSGYDNGFHDIVNALSESNVLTLFEADYLTEAFDGYIVRK